MSHPGPQPADQQPHQGCFKAGFTSQPGCRPQHIQCTEAGKGEVWALETDLSSNPNPTILLKMSGKSPQNQKPQHVT